MDELAPRADGRHEARLRVRIEGLWRTVNRARCIGGVALQADRRV